MNRLLRSAFANPFPIEKYDEPQLTAEDFSGLPIPDTEPRETIKLAFDDSAKQLLQPGGLDAFLEVMGGLSRYYCTHLPKGV